MRRLRLTNWARSIDWYAAGALILAFVAIVLAVVLALVAPVATTAAIAIGLFAVVLAVLSLRT